MLLYPKKTKFKAVFSRKRIKCFASSPFFSSSLKCFAIISCEAGKINNKQIESVRKVLKRSLKGYGKFWLNIFSTIPATKKSEGVRMGKGKGNIKFWFATVSKGNILAEINGCSWNHAKKVVGYIQNKLSVKVFLFVNKTT